jgi:hypothetical protein
MFRNTTNNHDHYHFKKLPCTFKKTRDTNASIYMVSTPIHPSIPVNFKIVFGSFYTYVLICMN